jgi:antirestriction protein ArdC
MPRRKVGSRQRLPSSATECLYSTLLHELSHWTGIKTRCDREFGKRFGDDAYAMEELVAELGAAVLCADLGIANTPLPDHAAYINHWLAVLKADKKAIFTAASKAAQAVDYLDALQQADEAHDNDAWEEAA